MQVINAANCANINTHTTGRVSLSASTVDTATYETTNITVTCMMHLYRPILLVFFLFM